MFNYIILALPSSAVLKPVQAGLGKIDSPYFREFFFHNEQFSSVFLGNKQNLLKYLLLFQQFGC